MSETVLKIETESAVRTLTLNRPQALNALNTDLLSALGDALAAAAADDAVKVVVLTGEGRAFSAGMDLKLLAASGTSGGDIGAELNALARRAISLIETMPKPVIARVNGFCFTGALELVLACDLVVAATEAIFGDTHAKVGLRPTWGMSQRLPRAVGIRKAREMAFTARNVPGGEAAAIGLANFAVPLADLDAKVCELSEAIAANAAESIAAYKDLFAAAQSLGLKEGIAFEEGARYPMGDASARMTAALKK